MGSGRPGPLSVDANGLKLGSPPKAAAPVRPAERHPPERYRRLPTGAHGMARDEVARDQRERLQRAMTELIADRGYQAVRILDLTQLAHVSRPTFYELYPDKEELLLAAYNDIAARTATTAPRASCTRSATNSSPGRSAIRPSSHPGSTPPRPAPGTSLEPSAASPPSARGARRCGCPAAVTICPARLSKAASANGSSTQ